MLKEQVACKCGCGVMLLKYKTNNYGFMSGGIRVFLPTHFRKKHNGNETRWAPPDTSIGVKQNCSKCGSTATYKDAGSDQGVFYEALVCFICGLRVYPQNILGKGRHEY